MKKDKPDRKSRRERIEKRYSEISSKQISSLKPIIAGIIAALCLLLFYSVIMLLSNSVKLALLQFYDIWYWIFILMFGFGTQVGLFVYLREIHKQKIQNLASANASVTSSAAISGTSMVACCAHHLTDLLPIIGFSAFALFLNRYQTVFILVGVFSNMIGMLIMVRMLQKFNAKPKNFLLKNALRLNLNFAINVVALIGIIVILITIGFTMRG